MEVSAVRENADRPQRLTNDTRHQVAAIDVPLKLSTIRDFGARDCYKPERLMFFTSHVMAKYLEEQANKPW